MVRLSSQLPDKNMPGESDDNQTDTVPTNLPVLLRQRVAADPDKHFLFSEADGRRFTYAEFERAVNRTAALLAAHGIHKGDVVGLLMPNRDRKSTRLNSSHTVISYAVFCLKKKKYNHCT